MSRTAPEILSHAASLVKDARAADHGSWEANSITAARIAWALDLDAASAEDWPLLMVALKLARIKETPENPDHYTDAAGYLGLAYEQRQAVSAYVPGVKAASSEPLPEPPTWAQDAILAAAEHAPAKLGIPPIPPGCFCAHYTGTPCPTCAKKKGGEGEG